MFLIRVRRSELLLHWLVVVLACPVWSAAQAADWVYTVQHGDNPWSLTSRYLAGVKYWPRIQKLNQITDPLHISPGTRLRIPVEWLRRASAVVTVVSVKGEARVSGRQAGKPVTPGMQLGSGDILRTGSKSNATLEFGDGSRVLLHAQAELHLDQLGHYENTDYYDSQVRLIEGRMENVVTPLTSGPGRFEISTPAAVTAVRGTRYRVNASAADTRAEVIEGTVDVATDASSVDVDAGYGTVAAAAQVPLAPVILLSPPNLAALPAVVERVPLSFTVPLQQGAKGHRFQILPAAATSELLFDARTDSAQLRADAPPDGDYVLRVRDIDAQDLEGLDAERPFTLNARPEPPLLTTPAPGAGVSEDQPSMNWGASTTIARYRLQVASDDGFTQLVMDDDSVSTAGASTPASLPLGIYFWRVAAIDAMEGQGPFSDVQQFRRIAPAPALDAPAVEGNSMSVRWRAGEPGEIFQFQLAADEQFSAPLIDVRVTEAVATFELPKKGGPHFMRVKSIAADGFEGNYGAPQRIEVPGRHGSRWWAVLLLPLIILAL